MLPAPRQADEHVTVHHSDCLDVLRELSEASIDAVITDPPYGIGFMGKEWDGPGKSFVERKPARLNTFDHVGGNHNPTCSTDAARTRRVEAQRFGAWCEAWVAECLRVLRPGGHLLAFGGTRTWHRMACAIEDAGFEIRDSITWLYGSGFPKSLDVSKAIDKVNGDPFGFRLFARAYAAAVDASAWTHAEIDRRLGIAASSCYWAREDRRGGLPPRHHWESVRELLDLPAALAALYDEAEREVIGQRTTGLATGRGAVTYIGDSENRNVTAPATAAARSWNGWGTALKPASEPIVVARKPLVGTVAQNVLAHGTGALNIDACRTAFTSAADISRSPRVRTGTPTAAPAPATTTCTGPITGPEGEHGNYSGVAGRWPTNAVLTHTEECVPVGQRKVKGITGGTGNHAGSVYGARSNTGAVVRDYADADGTETIEVYACAPGCPVAELDACASGASRFFPTFRYQAKAPARERPKVDGVTHPTVKPLALMRWLVRLVTPPDGVVLDPFAGSGTTVEACLLEGVRCVAVEREADYLPLVEARIERSTPPLSA